MLLLLEYHKCAGSKIIIGSLVILPLTFLIGIVSHKILGFTHPSVFLFMGLVGGFVYGALVGK